MKKVSGFVSVRPLGCYNFEFYVDDDVTKEEIEKQINDICQYFHYYDIEEGYEEYTEVCYRKRS